MTAFRKLFFTFALLTSIRLCSQTNSENPAGAVSEALRARDYDKAIELGQAALEKAPNSAQLWTLQGIAYASKGDNKQAKAAFQHALKISPDNIAALAGAAQIEYQAGSQEGIPLLNHLVQLRPNDPTAHAMLAVLEYRGAKCEAAVAHFEKAKALVDSQPDALHAYAACLVKLKRFEEAIAAIRRAASLQPQDLKERQVLASVQLMAGKSQDALLTLRPLLDSQNPEPRVLQLASRAYEDSGDTPQAVATLRQALLLNPRDTSLYLDFANICFSHESFQVGIDVLTEGLTLEPKADDLYVARGVLYVQLAQYDKAEADFEKAYELNPNQ